MLKLADVSQLTRGLADKSVGLVLETVGTLVGNERLKDAGRSRQDSGTERLLSVEEETKATSRAADAEVQEQRQKRYQAPDRRSPGRAVREQGSALSGTAEKAKGLAKEGVGAITGNEDLKAEGETQQEKAEAQTQAAKHDAKATAHRAKADAELKASDARR